MSPKLLVLVPLALAALGCGSHRSAQSPAVSAPSSEVAALEAGWNTDFGRHTVPLTQFQSGGPGKDGIPAIDRPRFLPVARVHFLRAHEPIIELVVHGEARAYPLQILVWHEIVNDTVGSVPVAVTFCPLCNTAIAFDRRVEGRTLSFGTTGDLRNSDLVMYDRQTQSWWQQFGGEGVVGHYAGTRLRVLPGRIVSWQEFRTAHSDALVLSRATGYSRPYGQNPYVGYDDVSSSPLYPVANAGDDRLQPKERVVFVQHDRHAVAVPFSVLAKKKRVEARVGGLPVDIRWHGGVNSALDADQVAEGRDVGGAEVVAGGKQVPFTEPFWFAVAAFRPHVRVLRSGAGSAVGDNAGDANPNPHGSIREAAVLLAREQHHRVSVHDRRVHVLARIIDSLQRRCARVDQRVNARWIGSLITDARTRPRLEQRVHGYLAAARALDLIIPEQPRISCYLILTEVGGA